MPFLPSELTCALPHAWLAGPAEAPEKDTGCLISLSIKEPGNTIITIH